MDLPAHKVALRRTDLEDKQKESALRSPACDAEEDAVYYDEWAARVRAFDRPQANQVPLALRNGGEPLMVSTHKHVSLLPFSARYAAVATDRLPQPRLQRRSAYGPRHLGEIVTEDARMSIEAWLMVAASNLHATRVWGAEHPKCPPGISAAFGSCHNASAS